MQVVAVKPIPRWQIWLGKWLGIVTLNATLLALSGACVYGLMLWRAGKLPANEQKKLYEQVLVSRASIKEPPVDVSKAVEARWQKRLQEEPIAPHLREYVHKQIEDEVRAEPQVVRPHYQRLWKLDARHIKGTPAEQSLRLRIKFFAADQSTAGTLNGAYNLMWLLGKPGAPNQKRAMVRLAAESFQEFMIPGNAIADDGFLYLSFVNANEVTILFPLADGLELLYAEGGFALNYARGLLIVLFWIALLAAIGLAAASYLSFPTAAFFAGALMVIVFASGTMTAVVEEGSIMGRGHHGEKNEQRIEDVLLLPVFRGMLQIISLTQSVSPIDAVTSGRSITWGQVAESFGEIVLLLGGAFGVAGIVLFNRRELATAQGTS